MQTLDIDVQDEYGKIAAFFDEADRVIAGLEDMLYHVDEAVSQWSPAQHLHHIFVSNGMMLKGVELIHAGRGPVTEDGEPNQIGRTVLQRERLPRGKAQAPERVRPADRPDRNTLADALARSRARLVDLQPLLPLLAERAGRLPHPYLGQLNAAEWLRIVRVHSEHHLAILPRDHRRADVRAGMNGQPQEHHVLVQRQARYYTLGTPGPATREVWFALHGYGQLARYFIRHFRPLDDGSRFVVAPEALSRFYLGGAGQDRRVGAAWMTREDRLAEIGDYIAYLDALYARTFTNLDRARTDVHVLAFSQGTATACRWLTDGNATADRLILWGGALPHDFNFERHRTRLNKLRLTLVTGTEDAYATPEKVREEEARLRAEAVAFQSITYDGGHRLDADVLGKLAGVETGGRPG